MLSKIEKFFKNRLEIQEEETGDSLDNKLMVSTTVLFLEMAYADFDISVEEEKHIKTTLHDFFNLKQTEINELIKLASDSRDDRNDIWLFTNLIKENFNREQRLRILEQLWRLIFADSKVDRYEDALIRKITNLLGLEHREMIQAKLKAKNSQ